MIAPVYRRCRLCFVHHHLACRPSTYVRQVHLLEHKQSHPHLHLSTRMDNIYQHEVAVMVVPMGWLPILWACHHWRVRHIKRMDNLDSSYHSHTFRHNFSPHLLEHSIHILLLRLVIPPPLPLPSVHAPHLPHHSCRALVPAHLCTPPHPLCHLVHTHHALQPVRSSHHQSYIRIV